MKKFLGSILVFASLVASAQVFEVTAGINHFAFEVYKQNAVQKGNFIFSPFSIEAVMSMVTAGARGETLKQMNKVLHFNEETPSEFKKILPLLKGDKNFQLSTANRLWGQEGIPFETGYLSLLKENYGSDLTPLDFSKSTEESRLKINRWVEEQTQNKIQNLIEKGMLDKSTRLVLTNAIYFKGTWFRKFDAGKTMKSDFFVTPQNKKKVPFMNMTSAFNYTETNEFQILEMNYNGDEIVMDVVLPKENVDFAKFESKMGPNLIFENGLSQAEVVVILPKAKVDTKIELSKQLTKLGMPLAFSQSKADLQGIMARQKSRENLYLDKVVHQATVNIDEDGTEAAAATAAVAKGFGAAQQADDIKFFTANRPFIFFIRHAKTGMILFMGRISDP